MRVLVVGGAGYIGSHTVRQLQLQGIDVWVYDNLSFGHRAAVPADRFIPGDLQEIDRLDHALMIHQIDAVMHFAAFAYVGESVTDPAKYYINNFSNTVQLLDRCRRQGIKKFVFSSTCATYGIPDKLPITEDTPQNPINPYGRTKWMVEQVLADFCRAYQLGYAALRYFNAAGAAADGSIGEDHDPETHLIPLVFETILGKRPQIQIFGTDYPTPDGTCIRDYVHVDDLAGAHIAALQLLEPGKSIICNLGTGQGYSVREVIRTAEMISGKKCNVIESARREGDPAELVASPERAMKLLGWKPQFLTLEGIMESAWNWHRQHPDGFNDRPKKRT